MLDAIIAPPDHAFPAGHRDAAAFGYDTAPPGPRQPARYTLEPGIVKPNPAAVHEILDRFGVDATEAIYIGDSLVKDIALAQSANVTDAFAAYGRGYDPVHWQRLVDITHWTPEAVAREQRLRQRQVEPTYRVDSFAEVLNVIADHEQGQPGERAPAALSR
jgi:phosphoglycolate phosphatase